MGFQLSRRALAITSSAIREILKVTQDPAVISFAGGVPSPLTFPVKRMQEACDRIFGDDPQSALQYAPTEGDLALRTWVAQRHGVTPDDVLMTTGSQQALDLIGKVLIDAGSPVLVESPTYLGALQAFSMSDPEYREVPCDAQGMLPDQMTDAMLAGARFLYAMPNFQNPTGRRIPLARREALVARLRAAGVPLVEDDPYGDLSYGGEQLPSLHSMYPEGTIYLGSFSKILAPGLRIGYAIAPPEVMFKLVQAKQAADLHTPSFNQRLAREALSTGFLPEHIVSIRKLYAAQCEAMLAALKREMPEGVSWNRPEGGMFVWVSMPEHIDAQALLERALAADRPVRVAFVPGAPFFANSPKRHTLRLSFVTVPIPRIDAGVKALAELIRAS